MAAPLCSLSRGELQKLCTQKKKEGALPKDTKCNGKTGDLIKMLLELESAQRKTVGNYVENYDSSYGYLRGIAPYLSLDLLIASMAYYPDHPLLKEIEDPQGKIWADRSWVEKGRPPLEYPNQGYRYDNLTRSQTLKPHGYISLFDSASGKSMKTKKRARLVSYISEVKTKRVSGGSVRPFLDIKAIAWTERGIETLYHSAQLFKTNNHLEEEVEALNGEGWTLITPGPFRSVVALSKGSQVALDYEGNLRVYNIHGEEPKGYVAKITKNPRNYPPGALDEPSYKFVSLTFVFPFLEVFDLQGNQYFLIPQHRESRDLTSDLVGFSKYKVDYQTRTSVIRGPEQHVEVKGPDWGLRMYVKTPSPDQEITLRGRASYYTDLPGVLEEMVYFLPIPELVDRLVEVYGVLPRKFLRSSHILGVNGNLYKYSKKNQTLSKIKWPDRLFEVSLIGPVFAGIAW